MRNEAHCGVVQGSSVQQCATAAPVVCACNSHHRIPCGVAGRYPLRVSVVPGSSTGAVRKPGHSALLAGMGSTQHEPGTLFVAPCCPAVARVGVAPGDGCQGRWLTSTTAGRVLSRAGLGTGSIASAYRGLSAGTTEGLSIAWLARPRGQRKGASVGSVQDNGELRITRELEQAHLEEIRF